MPASNVTLYAQWTQDDTYNVTYDANGGTGTQTDATNYFAGDSVTVKDQGTMAKANNTFTGWNTEAGGGGTGYVAGNTFSMPASNVTLYAQWECDPCSPDGWDSTDVIVEKWYAGSSGHSDPRVDASGTIIPPDCLTGSITITLRVELYNNGWQLKETVEKTLTLPSDNTFDETFDNISASYNSINNYKLMIQPDGCSNWIEIATGTVLVKAGY